MRPFFGRAVRGMLARAARPPAATALLAAGLVLSVGLAPGAARATNLFGLLDTGELYRSTNAGVTWSAIGTIPVHDAVGIAAGTASTELFLASRSGTVYRSANGGTTWSAVGAVVVSDVAGFALSPFGKVFVLTSTGTLYSSSNQGSTFAPVAALAGSDWVSLAPGPHGRMYALTKTGQVAESLDEGATWATVGVITTSGAVAIRRLGAQLFVVASTGEVYRSTNFGASWTPVGALSQGGMSAMVDLDAQLVTATKEGEVATSANGVSWTWVGAINQLNVVALGTDTPTVTGVTEERTAPRFVVGVPYPNPRTGGGGATFPFALSTPDRVRLELYDVSGRLKAVRPSEWIPADAQAAIRWEPASLASGTYFVRLVSESGPSAQVKWSFIR